MTLKSNPLKTGLFTVCLILLLFASSAFADVTANACGVYTLDQNNGVTQKVVLTGNIVASGGSTITEGACVVIRIVDRNVGCNFRFAFNGFNITNSGSSATTAIMFENGTTAGTLNTLIGTNDSGGISNFIYGIKIVNSIQNYSQFAMTSNVLFRNVTYGVFYNSSTMSSNTMTIKATVCNSGVAYIRGLGVGTTTITINTTSACAAMPIPEGDPISLYYSNKLFSTNGNITNFSYVAMMSDGMTYNVSYLGYNYSQTTTTSNFTVPGSAYQVVNYTGITDVNIIYLTGVSNRIFNGKFWYIIGGLQNAMQLNNYPGMPIYLNVPDFLSGVALMRFNYSTLQLYWHQGMVDYLVFSSSNNNDTVAYLLNGGVYLVNGTINGNATYGYTYVICSSGYCFLDLSNLVASPVPISYSYSGICSQMNLTQSRCTFLTNAPFNVTWDMNITDIATGVPVCNATFFGIANTATTLICNYNASGLVTLYANGNKITYSLLSNSTSGGSIMWIIIYVGSAIVILFITTRVPIIMALAEILLTYIFFLLGTLTINYMIAFGTIWFIVLFGFGVLQLKKGNIPW